MCCNGSILFFNVIQNAEKNRTLNQKLDFFVQRGSKTQSVRLLYIQGLPGLYCDGPFRQLKLLAISIGSFQYEH